MSWIHATLALGVQHVGIKQITFISTNTLTACLLCSLPPSLVSVFRNTTLLALVVVFVVLVAFFLLISRMREVGLAFGHVWGSQGRLRRFQGSSNILCNMTVMKSKSWFRHWFQTFTTPRLLLGGVGQRCFWRSQGVSGSSQVCSKGALGCLRGF